MEIQKPRTEVQPLSAAVPDYSQKAARFFSGPWPLPLAMLLATLPYVGVVRNGFTYAYDDKTLILDSPYVHNFQHLRELFTTTLWSNQGVQAGTPYYRPMAKLSFLLCYQLFGPSPFGYHLFSLLLNAVTVAILFLVAEQLFGDRAAAFASATLFALHPVHVEAVAWISAVPDVEMTFFCLLAFWCFLRVRTTGGRSKVWAIATTAGSFALAVCSKEPATTIPALAVGFEHFYRQDRRETTVFQKILRYGLLGLVGIGYILLRVRLLGSMAHTTKVNPLNLEETLLSALALVSQYMGILLWPWRLSAFHPFHASVSLTEMPVVCGVGTLAMCAFLFCSLWNRARPASFGILWLFVTLLPVLNARWMGAYVLGERYLYLPSVGFCLTSGWVCAALWKLSAGATSAFRTAVVAAVSIVMALCVLRVSLRLLDWRDDITLFTVSLAAAPNDYRLHDALGVAYWTRGNEDGAEQEWKETLRLAPNSVEPLDSLGVLYAQQRRFGQAVPVLEKAVRLSPNDPTAHLNLGAAYAEMGKMDHAEEQFRAAVFLFPLDFVAHNLLGKLYYDSRRLAEAEEEFRASLACEPNLAAYDYLGYIAMQRGDRVKAEAAFTEALAVKRTDSHALFNLGLIHAASGQKTQAREELQAALASDPNNPEILSALEKLRQ